MKVDRAVLVLKMMGNPIRLKILEVLAKKKTEVCVSGIEDLIGVSQSSVSQHLAHLRNSGILTSEKKGKKVCYNIVDDTVREILNSLNLENIK